MGVSITAKPRDVVIRFVNNLFPGGSYEAYLEESQRLAMEKMGMTPEGDWLPEVKEKMIIKKIDADGNVTYTGNVNIVAEPGTNVVIDTLTVINESVFDWTYYKNY